MGEYCIFEKDKEKKVATLIFNRPEKLNAATTKGWEEIIHYIMEAEEDEDIKVVILKGAGSCFGTGHDVNDLGPHHGWGEPTDRRPSQRRRFRFDDNVFWGRRGLAQTILNCDKATIAQVHGYCYGGHIEIAMACDIVIASEDAKFVHPGYRYIGPLGGIVLAIHTMGVRKAKEMMLTGTPLTAQEALDCNMVNRVVPADKLEEEVNRIAGVIALQPFDALVLGKANFELALDIMGVTTGFTAGYITHTLQTNIRYEKDEFNLFRVKRDKKLKEAFSEREKRFSDAPLRDQNKD